MGNAVQVLYLFQHPICPLLITFKPKSAAILALPRICGGGKFEFVWSLDKGGELTGGAVAEEASAPSIEILLSGEKSKFDPKTHFFLRPLQGVPVTVFLQIRDTFVGFFSCRTHF